MKVLFLIEGWISPAPRYRVLQFLPHLIEQGITFKVRSLHGLTYPFFYHWPAVGPAYKALVRSRRWWHLRDAHEFDVVFLQRLTLPFTSFIERRAAKRNPRLIFDFDDAIYQTPAGDDPRRMRVFKDTVGAAATVIAGSDYLAGHACEGAHVIPTVINTLHYTPAPKPDSGKIVIGWMGTHSNYPNFIPLLPALRALLDANPQVEMRIVGDLEPPFSLPRTQFVKWHKDREIADLRSFDIGIMPLLDSSWNRGKCAFKLIQYMSVGLPVVAGAVGANLEVVVPDETGFLAQTPEQWTASLSQLIEDQECRLRLGQAGRLRCEQSYSVLSQQDRLLEIITATARGNHA